MFFDRYDFQDTELVIYYPDVKIKTVFDKDYIIHNIFIHLDYDNNVFALSKLYYKLEEYVNDKKLFVHPHFNSTLEPCYKSKAYCVGQLNMHYTFYDILNVINTIGKIDFWLHNENSSDCYFSIRDLIFETQINSISSMIFKYNIKKDLKDLLINSLEIKNTIFGRYINISIDIDEFEKIIISNVLISIKSISDMFKYTLSKYQDYVISFKGKNYYLKAESFDAEKLMTNGFDKISQDVLHQFTTLSREETTHPSFDTGIEEYFFENL
jgi:hypothetical protein